ncbi:MAG: DUF2608 domain-containing protein [Chlamydiota bacterium]
MYEIPKNLEVLSLDSFSLIGKRIEDEMSEDTLVFFDVHWTLLRGDSPAMHPQMRIRYEKVFQRIFSSHSPVEVEMAVCLALRSGKQSLMEKDISKILLQLSKGKLLACSSYMTGKIGPYSLEADVFGSLQGLGVDFSSSFPDVSSLVLDQFPLFHENFPMYYRGILLTNHQSKGRVMVDFLKKVGFFAKRVILVDNNPKKIGNVKEVLKEFDSNLQFEGIFYTKALSEAVWEVSEEEFTSFWEGFAKEALLYSGK